MTDGSHHSRQMSLPRCALQSQYPFLQSLREPFLSKGNLNYTSGAYFRQIKADRFRVGSNWSGRRLLMLPRLLPVGPDDVADVSIAGRERIIRRLMRALRGERARGRAGHWSYDLNRHAGLVEALAEECAGLRAAHGKASYRAMPPRSDPAKDDQRA